MRLKHHAGRGWLGALAALTLWACAGTAGAANLAGKVISLRGQATAATASGQIRVLRWGAKVFSGDTIVTNPNSYVRIKFTDDGYVLVRPNSRFLIEDYRHDVKKPKEDHSFFSLIKGGFRAITGLIGHRNHNAYAVHTTVATIGIRGTDFEGRICNNDCQDVNPPPPNGLYVGVFKPYHIVVVNNGGQCDLKGGQYCYVGGLNTAPKEIPKNQATPLIQDPMPTPTCDQ